MLKFRLTMSQYSQLNTLSIQQLRPQPEYHREL